MCINIAKKSAEQTSRDQAQVDSMSSWAVEYKAGKNDYLFNVTIDDVSWKN